MEYLRIEEKKWATLILLEKINDMYSFEFPNDARSYSKAEALHHSHSINEFVTVNGTNYKIEHDLLKNTLSDFESEKMIKIIDFMPMTIVESIKNPLVYANEEITRNSSFTIEDLDKDMVFEYEIVLKDLNKIRGEIAKLHESGISLVALSGSTGKNSDDEESKNDRELTKLISKKVTFDDSKAQIVIGDTVIQLPSAKNEYLFCKSMFKYPVGEFVDWSTLYEAMAGEEFTDKIKNKRAVIDTIYAINKRISKFFNTRDKLFTRENNTIKRNF